MIADARALSPAPSSTLELSWILGLQTMQTMQRHFFIFPEKRKNIKQGREIGEVPNLSSTASASATYLGFMRVSGAVIVQTQEPHHLQCLHKSTKKEGLPL